MNFTIPKEKIFDLITALLIVFYIMLSLILELRLFERIQINRFHIIVTGLFIILLTQRKIKFYSLSHGVKKTSFLAIILFIFIVFNSFLVRPQILFGALFNLLMGIVIGKHLGLNKFTSKILLFPFWFLLVYIVFKLFKNPNPNEVFIRSRNYISFFLILTVLPYYFTRINLNKTISILPALLTLILSVYSLGRSGILSATILFIGVILASKINIRTKKIIGFMFLISVIFVIVFYLRSIVTINEFERLTRLSEYSNLGGRSTFFKNYFDNLDLFSFIFGMDVNTYKILNIGGGYLPGHVHSSILNFISVTGISSFYFFFILMNKMKGELKNNLPLVFLLTALIIRIFSETGVLFGYFDYVVWMFFFFNQKQHLH